MAESFENEKPIKAWLSTPEAQTLIRKAARAVLRVAREKRYSFTFMGLESATTLANGFVLEEVESALKLFILENRRGIQEKLMISGAKGGFVLRSAFIRDWIDATRNRRSDQWRYLYKRSLGAIRGAKGFKRKKTRDGAVFYSLADDSVTIPEPCAEDLLSIPFPHGFFSSATFEELNKAGSLLALAKHLWSELSNKSGGKPCWVPVRTLINWISAHVPIDKEQMFDQDRSGGRASLKRRPGLLRKGG